MVYIYFDESGDLGFDFSKRGTSRHFSIAFLITTNKRPIISLVKKVFVSLPTKLKSKGLLHAHHEKFATIKKLLNGLITKEIQIATVYLDKHKYLSADNPHQLYADMVITLVNRLYQEGVLHDTDEVSLIASQRNTNRKLNEHFSDSVLNNSKGLKLALNIVKPFDDKCLQAVDFISWAYWQKYENNDSTYSDVLADKNIFEYKMPV
jgi:hypothetical protein